MIFCSFSYVSMVLVWFAMCLGGGSGTMMGGDVRSFAFWWSAGMTR